MWQIFVKEMYKVIEKGRSNYLFDISKISSQKNPVYAKL